MSILDYHISLLPRDVVRYIFEYVIPDYSNFKFIYYEKDFQIAYNNNLKVENDEEYFLTRIYKKNGKHRYYISKQYTIRYCEDCNGKCKASRHYDCYGKISNEIRFKNKYIGKDIITALLHLFH